MTGGDWSRAVRLYPAELLACWHVSGLGETPPALQLGPLGGATEPERRRVLADLLAGLRARGLADAGGACAPLAGALRLLARPAYSIDIRRAGPGGGLEAVGAVAGTRGVLALRRFGRGDAGQGTVTPAAARSGSGGMVSLLPVPAGAVPAALVALAGQLTPGRARPVNIPAEVLDDAVAATLAGSDPGSHWRLADQLTRRGVDRADAHSLARMCTGITVRGQLGATAIVDGRSRRGPWVVGFHRCAEGDFVQLRRPAPADRPAMVTVAPITTDRLLGHLYELLRAPDRAYRSAGTAAAR